MRARILLLYVCFFISGASALIYEIVWQRMLTLVFGLSTLSVAAVLAAFLAGLAVGAPLFGGVADRTRRPARLYALIELGMALLGAASGFSIAPIMRVFVALHSALDPGWLGSNLIRFVLAFVALGLPSILIGATVPIMSRLVSEWAGSVAVAFGRFYAVNTLGAVAGAALAGFILIRTLGMSAALTVAVAGNLLVAILALLASGARAAAGRVSLPANHGSAGASPFRATPERATAFEHPPHRRFALAAATLSGAAALGYEVIWTRVLAIYTLNSVYVFTMVVTVYLTALAIGAGVITRVARTAGRDPLRMLMIVQMVLALLAPVMLACAPSAAKLNIGASGQSESQILFTEYLLTLALVFVPALLIGMMLPLLVNIYSGTLSTAGRSVARVYAWNSLGTILGAALTGALLIPVVGLRDTMLALAVANFLLGAAAAVIQPEGASRGWRAFAPSAAGAFVLLVALLPPSFRFYRPESPEGETLLDYAEGPSATVHVAEFEQAGKRYRKLFVDSEAVAGTYDEIVTDQKMLAHLPLLLHPNPQRALTVGFGTGGTSYSMLQHKVQVDCVEIEPFVPQAYKYFESENHGIVGPAHERQGFFHLILDDARSWLESARAPYDVIVTDVTSIQYRGNGNLYTTDYFRLMQSKLTASGLGCAWVPATGIRPQQLKILIRSFRSVFAHTSVWYMINLPTDFVILVGTPQKLALDLANIADRMAAPLIQRDLAVIGMDNPYKLAACLLLAEEDVGVYLGDSDEDELHSDNRPILDYLTHASRGQDTLALNLNEMLQHRADAARYATAWPGRISEAPESWPRWYSAAAQLMAGHMRRRAGRWGGDDGALAAYRAAAALVPEDSLTRSLLDAAEVPAR
ncbi:MAG TPA: fused MFS/spermidine synthase [Phycisphaerae bacterium]